MVTNERLPGWWQREKQRRLTRVLFFLTIVGALVVYFYYINASGLTGAVGGINFDSKNYIAFVRDDGKGHTDLYAIKLDGTGERRLTPASDSSTKMQPVWTLDGKSLLYASNLDDAKVTQIYILGDGSPTRLTYGAGNKSCPTVSPDGKHAAFISQGAIKSVYLNGKEVTQLMPRPRDTNVSTDENKPVQDAPLGSFLSIALSNDGSGVAGAQDCSDESSMGTTDRVAANNTVTCIPPGSGKTVVLAYGRDVSMAWEAKGTRLACAFSEYQAPNSSNPKDLIPTYHDWNASIRGSTDSTLESGIWIYSFTGKEPTYVQIFTGIRYSIAPKNIAWSPDGTRLAFEGWRLYEDGRRELEGLVVMPLNKGSEGSKIDEAHVNLMRYMKVSSAEGKPQLPKWSPDGMHILYEMLKPDGKRDLWAVNADGTNAIDLTKGMGDCYDGAWSPAQ